MKGRIVLGLVVSLALLSTVSVVPASAQKQLSPSETVLAFYRLLRAQQYHEGFAVSVFHEAVDGLSDEELAELSTDFQQTFAEIPDKITIRGEQISGDTATVFVQFGADETAQEVGLVRDEGRWLVGDRDSLERVHQEKTEFFFNARIRVNQDQVFQVLRRIARTEAVLFQTRKAYASLDDLVATEGFGSDLENGISNGYRFIVNLTPDRQAFTAIAVPVRYGRTGRLSFFTDGRSVFAADARGLAVNEQSPVLVRDIFKDEAPAN